MPRLMEDAMTFSALARACLVYLSANLGRAERTTDTYDRIYGSFRAYLKTRGLTDDLKHFTTDVIEAYVTARHGQHIHPNTIRNELSALRTFAAFAMKRRDDRGRFYLTTDPTRAFEWPTFVRPTIDFLYVEEQARLLAAPQTLRERFALELIWETGLRASEVCRANICDMEQTGDRWYLRVTVKGRGRQAERLAHPLSAELGALWVSWLDERALAHDPRDQGPFGAMPLLLNGEGQRFRRSTLWALIRRLGQRAGITRIRVGTHKLRHTANVNERQAGVERTVRAQRRHHTGTAALDRYEHVMPEESAQATDQTRAWIAERMQTFTRTESGLTSPNTNTRPPEDPYEFPDV